jgi:EAL domain-containing protein (putative c-di-GMP-specific phosphodiesterase class I)
MADRTDVRPRQGEAKDWAVRIREALERDRFAMHAQRIVEVSSGETLRHELFLRMVDKERVIPAGEFVVAAEEHGSIGEIDRWVAGKAIDIAAAGWPVHVNLSIRSTDEALLRVIREGLEATGADAGDLVFELGEGQLEGAGKEGAGFVQALSDLGCGIALDNYVAGKGKADLLKRYPLDYVKIGPELVGELGINAARREAVGAVVSTAHRFGRRVIAQGAETLVALQALEELQVDEAQGYVLGPPEPVETLLGAQV